MLMLAEVADSDQSDIGKSRPRVLPDAEQFLHQWHAIDKSALAELIVEGLS